MVRRLGLALLLGVTLTAVAVPGWIALNQSDLPVVDDADLEAADPPPADGEDGWNALLTASALTLDEDFGDGSRLRSALQGEEDRDWVDELWRNHAAAFQELERALSAPRISIPTFPVDGPNAEDWDALLAISDLVRVAAARSRNLAIQGDRANALEHAVLGLRVGRSLSEARQPNLLVMMFAVATQSISLRQVEFILRGAPLSPEEAIGVVRRLGGYRLATAAWPDVWASEYRFARSVIRNVVQEPEREPDVAYREMLMGLEGDIPRALSIARFLPSSYLFQPNRTVTEFAGIYRELAERSVLDCAQTYRGDADSIRAWQWTEETHALWELLRPNFVGRMVVQISAPNYMRFDLKRCHADTKISLLQTLVGLTAYQRANGELPASLDALVPDYLPAVPEDRFDGQPIRYSRERALVYSVGEDFTDDGPPADPSLGEPEEPAILVGL